MFKSFVTLTLFFCVLTSSSLFAICCQSVDVKLGWRRDSLHWKLSHLDSSYVSAQVHDRIRFDEIDTYTLSGKAKWVAADYYIRFSAEYGLTEKGRAHEHFAIKSPYLYYPIGVHTSDPIKRRSEVYDFNGAVGYPFSFFECRLSVIPLIGFSFHRQHLRVKENRDSRSSSSEFSVSSSNSFVSYSSDYSSSEYSSFQNPFESPSDPRIASSLGLSNPHRTDTYRFTWYGFYVGTDLAYALDSCWTLFSELEFHFLDRCHRKRKAWTGVYFVDDYHHEGWAYGFNGVVGVNYYLANCWYTTLGIDFNYWKGHSKHDELFWKTVGAKLGFTYAF